jgi:hypothetical protein
MALAVGSQTPAAMVTTTPFRGITYYNITETLPRVNRIHVVEIDLLAPGVRFQITPGNGDPNGSDPGDPNGETTVETTRSYVSRVGAQVGINASFFNLGGTPNNNNGLLVSNGALLSPHDGDRWDAFNVTMNNVASIVRAGAAGTFDVTPTVPLHNAVAGSTRLISAGAVVAPPPDGGSFLGLNPRTAVGVTANSKVLLMTVDGRQPGTSEGLTLLEVADRLRAFGAVDGLNLDGGGSTTMVMDFFDDGQGARVLNTPSAGAERANGANLAVFAERLGASPPPPPPNLVVIEDFLTGEGRFTSGPTSSGSNRGLNNTSTTLTWEPGETFNPVDGSTIGGSQRLNVVNNPADAVTGFVLRNLSGGGTPANNMELVAEGFIGFYLKTTTPGLQVSLLLDEQLPTATSRLEQGTLRDVIADGEWHLYEWNIDDAADWGNFAGGNGEIDVASVWVDAMYIRSLTEQSAVVNWDFLAQNRTGSLAAIPEPTGILAITTVMMLAQAHQRRSGRRML